MNIEITENRSSEIIQSEDREKKNKNTIVIKLEEILC